jgi:hypothetical protein
MAVGSWSLTIRTIRSCSSASPRRYNSMVFPASTTHGYIWAIVTESFPDGVPFTSPVDETCPTCSPEWRHFPTIQDEAPKWDKLEPADCIT